MNNISVFSCVDRSSRPTDTITMDEALMLIKNNPHKEKILKARESGKLNQEKTYPDGRNLYEHVKRTVVPVVTWNAVIDDYRRKSNISQCSGYIYGDVDSFQKIIDMGKAKDELSARQYAWKVLTNKGFKFIKGVWKSFGGDTSGFGFLVKVNGLTVENFKSTWNALKDLFAKYGIELDEQTKDITRPNVLSYDPDIFIREDDILGDFDAVEEKFEYQEVEVGPLSPEMRDNNLSNIIAKYYDSEDIKIRKKNRLAYGFYQRYFSSASNYGIVLDESFNYLWSSRGEYPLLFGSRSKNAIYNIGRNQYKAYQSSFGKVRVRGSKNLAKKDKKKVEAVYQKYEGDAEVKCEYLWYLLVKKQLGKAETLTRFAKVIKKCGIDKEQAISFLNSSIMLSDEDIAGIEKIYGNPNIIFGLVKKPTDDAIAERIRLFSEKMKSENKQIIRTDKFEGNLERKTSDIFESAKFFIGKPAKADVFEFLSYVFRKTKSFAISKVDAVAKLISYFTLSDDEQQAMEVSEGRRKTNQTIRLYKKFVRYGKFMAEEIYGYNQWKFGVRVQKFLTMEEVLSRYKVRKTHHLEIGQYISDLNLHDYDNTIIWGNTGQGKTTWICEAVKGLKIILVPTVSLVKGIRHDYGASAFFQDAKDVQEGDELIVCTYSSFPKLLKIMEKWDINPISDYALFFDEYHNNAVSASPLYRGYELNCIADNLHLFKSRTMLTGTNFPILHPVFQKFEVIRVNWKNLPIKRCQPVEYNNIYAAVGNRLDRNGKNFIFLQNKREEGQLGDLMEYLSMKGWDEKKIWKINADEKDNVHYQRLIENKMVDEDIEIVICTSVISEGVTIKNKDFTTIHFMSHASDEEKEQTVNRFRKIFTHTTGEPSCMIYTYSKIPTTEKEVRDHIDVVKVQENLIEMSKRCLKFFSRPFISGDSFSFKLAGKMFFNEIFGKSAWFRNKDGDWDVDYLSIANKAFVEQKNYSYENRAFSQMMLSQYGWKFNNPVTDHGDLLDQDKNLLRLVKQAKKDELDEDIQEIINTIREDGEKKTIELINDKNKSKFDKYPRKEWEIRLRAYVKDLCRNMEFNDACNLVEEWTTEHGKSPQKWLKIKRQLNASVSVKMGIFDKKYDVSSKFAKSLAELLKNNKAEESKTGQKKFMTLAQIKKAVSNRKKHCDRLNDLKITQSMALEIFHQYFEVKEYLIKNTIMYYLVGYNISNDIATSYKKIDAWIKDCHKNAVGLTSDEMAEKINSIRQELPVLGLTMTDEDGDDKMIFALTSGQAKRLLGDRYTMVHTSHRLVNGERKNVYTITLLQSEELMNVTIKPMRKVDISHKHVEDMTMEERKRFGLKNEISQLNYYLSMSKPKKLPF